MKISIVGENSKIGKSLIKHLPKGFELVEINQSPDYLFLATDSTKAEKVFQQYQSTHRIVDFSGSFKSVALKEESSFTYGFTPVFNSSIDHISFPGCSALAILTTLYPIKDLILPESIFADVKFSKSAMQYKSSRQQSVLQNQVELVNPFTHFHEQEINQILSPLKIKLVPSVINIPQGLFINLFFNTNSSVDIKSILEQTKNSDMVWDKQLPEILDTNLISLSVVQEDNRVVISLITDNLVNGKIYPLLF